MSRQQPSDDPPINLEESSSSELKREVVAEEDASPSTVAPVWTPKPHAKTESRELLDQPFGREHVE